MKIQKHLACLSVAALLTVGVGAVTSNFNNAPTVEAGEITHPSVVSIFNDVYNNVIALDSNNVPADYDNTSNWFIMRDSNVSPDKELPYGRYTVAYEVKLQNVKPSNKTRKLTYHYVKDGNVTLDKDPQPVPAKDDYGVTGTITIPAHATTAFAYMLTTYDVNADGAKIVSHKSYDHVPASPYSVKQIKKNILSGFSLTAKNSVAKKPKFTGKKNKPKFKLSKIKFTEDLDINMFGKRNVSVLNKKGKLPVDNYKLKATVTINNFKPSKKARKYDLVNRDGAAIAEVTVPKKAKKGSAKVNLAVHLTPKEYLVTIK